MRCLALTFGMLGAKEDDVNAPPSAAPCPIRPQAWRTRKYSWRWCGSELRQSRIWLLCSQGGTTSLAYEYHMDNSKAWFLSSEGPEVRMNPLALAEIASAFLRSRRNGAALQTGRLHGRRPK